MTPACSTVTPVRVSPLHAVHLQMRAKMMDFSGWSMPLHYRDGTVAEHLACRSRAAMFDVSHLGTVQVKGQDAFAVLQRVFTNDLGRIESGRSQYSHLLDPIDGSVADDVIIWWLSDECFNVMPNASNTNSVVQAITQCAVEQGARARVDVCDITDSRAVIAVQGPRTRELIQSVVPEVVKMKRFDVLEAHAGDVPVTVAGTGYTGEDGVEISVPAERSTEVWGAISSEGVTAAGLGARDTLRLEAGLPLYGHELGPGITSRQAGLGWVVRFSKGDFRGKEALHRASTLHRVEHQGSSVRMLGGLLSDDRRPPRAGCLVYRVDGRRQEVGVVTSGNFSPVLGRGIALAMLNSDCVVGDRLEVDLRGRPLSVQVVKPPFHKLSIA